MDNLDVAILTKLNALADRHGLKPYEYVATLDRSAKSLGCAIRFETPAETGDHEAAKVRSMYTALGVDRTGMLHGGEIAVLDAIDHALSVAPKSRTK
jgi:hypothetical protein